MQHMNKTLSPPTKPARVSVPVSAEALSAFQRLAKAGNMSTGRAIAEWLNDTVEAATFMATTMERARAAPKIVAAEMHAYALGLADETSQVMQMVKALGGRAGSLSKAGEAPRQAPDSSIPPSCNTGGKVPPKKIAPRGVKSGFPLPPAQWQAYADTNGVPPKAPK